MQQYATASTLYNFGRLGYVGAPNSMSDIPMQPQAVWEAQATELATKVSNLRLSVVDKMASGPTREAILTIIDTNARPPLRETTAIFAQANTGGYWTKALESAVLRQLELARNAYGAALGLSATTGGPVPATSKADVAPLPPPGAPPGVFAPLIGGGVSLSTVAILGLAAWFLFRR